MEELEICLNCEKNKTMTEPHTFEIGNYCELELEKDEQEFIHTNERYWSLCFDCYKKIQPDNESTSVNHFHNQIQFKKKYFEKFEKYGILRKIKKTPICLWYSVRPPNGTDEDMFIKRMAKFVSTNSITKGKYTFEWKYPDRCADYKDRHSIHFHGLLYGNIGKINFHIKRQPERWFNLNPKQKFWIYNEEDYQDKLEYIDGNTQSETKNNEKRLDKASRQELGLPNVIEI